ncbi:MAG: hypothetical protein QQN41_04915 [Nitrosopumilus sp.]
MAANDQIKNPRLGVPARNTFKVRLPYLHQAKHHNDEFKNLGYDYRGKILRKSTSSELWANPLQTAMMGQIEAMMTFVLEQVKMIKKWYSIAHEKDDLNIT